MKREWLVLITFITLSFIITSVWFSSDCPFTSFPDVEGHFITGLAYQNQLLEHGDIYPVSFKYHANGFYLFSYSPVSYLFPLIFRLFVNPRLAFLITYNLIYAFSAFTFFLLLRQNKGSFSGSFLFSLLFFFSGIMTLQFAVIGSYHSIAGLPFFFLSIIFLQKYEKNESTNNAFLFITNSVIAMSIHFFIGITAFILFTSYLVYKKEYKLLTYFLIGALITSFYYLPLFFYSTTLANQNQASIIFKPDKFWELIGFQLLPAGEGPGSTNHNFYNGPYWLIGTIISLAYLHKKKRLKKAGLFITFIIIIVLISILWSTITFFGNMASYDRVSFFLQLSFIMLTAITFSKFKWRLETPIISLTALLIAVMSINKEIYYKTNTTYRHYFTFFQLIITIVLFIYYLLLNKKRIRFNKFTNKNKWFYAVIIIIFLQYTLLFNNAQVASHVACMKINPQLITDAESILINEELLNLQSIPYYINSKIINSFGHSTLIKELPKLGEEEFYNFSVLGKIDTYLVLGNLSDEKIALVYRDKAYPLSIVRGGVIHRYELTQTNPLSFNVTIPPEHDSLIVRLFYHPWWRAFKNNRELIVSQHKWFLKISGLNNARSFRLVFDNTYFILGKTISLISLTVLGLIYFYQRNH